MSSETKNSVLEEEKELYKPKVIEISFEIQPSNYSNNWSLVNLEDRKIFTGYKIQNSIPYIKNWDLPKYSKPNFTNGYGGRKTFSVTFDPYIINSNVRGWTSLNHDVHLNPMEYNLDLVIRHEIAHNLFPGIRYEDEITRLGLTLDMDEFNLVWH